MLYPHSIVTSNNIIDEQFSPLIPNSSPSLFGSSPIPQMNHPMMFNYQPFRTTPMNYEPIKIESRPIIINNIKTENPKLNEEKSARNLKKPIISALNFNLIKN